MTESQTHHRFALSPSVRSENLQIPARRLALS